MDNKKLTLISRIKDSDIYFSFIKSPTAILSTVILVIIFFCSFFVELVTPYNPFDPSSLSLMDAFTPPSWTEDGLIRPSSVHDGGVNASIKDKDDGSKGLYGVTNSTKNEQKNIITSITVDKIAVGDFIKLK